MEHPSRKGMIKRIESDYEGSTAFPLITFNKGFPDKEILLVSVTVYNGEKSEKYTNKILCPWTSCKSQIEKFHGKPFTSAFVEILKETGKTFCEQVKDVVL